MTLISTSANNGSFEDWTDASEPPLEPQHEAIVAKPGVDLTIPGWTVRSDRGAGFLKRGSSSHLVGRYFGQSQAGGHLISDAYAQDVGIDEGTEVDVSFDLLVGYTQKKLDLLEDDGLAVLEEKPAQTWREKRLIEVLVYLVLDGSTALPEEPEAMHVLLGPVYVPKDHTAGNHVHVKNLKHKLSASEAEAADRNGIRLYLVFHKVEAWFYSIDKVKLKIAKPAS